MCAAINFSVNLIAMCCHPSPPNSWAWERPCALESRRFDPIWGYGSKPINLTVGFFDLHPRFYCYLNQSNAVMKSKVKTNLDQIYAEISASDMSKDCKASLLGKVMLMQAQVQPEPDPFAGWEDRWVWWDGWIVWDRWSCTLGDPATASLQFIKCTSVFHTSSTTLFGKFNFTCDEIFHVNGWMKVSYGSQTALLLIAVALEDCGSR